MDAEILDPYPIPATMAEHVALDRAAEILYVDRNFAGNPVLLTWVERKKSTGSRFTLARVDADEIAKLRAGGMRVAENIDISLATKREAVALIMKAAAYGASDIHFMLRGEHTEIQIVVKGGLRVLMRKTQAEGEALIRAIYQGIAKTRDAGYNPLDFQNAQIPGDALPPESGLSSARIVRGPCYPQAQNGAFLTMRLQYHAGGSRQRGSLPPLSLPRKPEGTMQLSGKGYTPAQLEKFTLLMDAPNGIVIFTGPTGSGKTTTMYEGLKELARTKPHRRLVTIEDPVEYPMDWAVQMAITGARSDIETGAAFGERLRVALRMAPHIILLGELRGPDVAVAALEAAVTGHQVLTTMHVTDPFAFVERLELMDHVRLNRRVYCDHRIVRGVVAQRLLPRLCPHCSELLHETSQVLPARMMAALSTWGNLDLVRVQGPGCERCGHDGTLDRFAVAEVVVMTSKIMQDLIEHGAETARDNHYATAEADPSMLASAMGHVLAGIVDPRAAEEAIDLIVPKKSEVTL